MKSTTIIAICAICFVSKVSGYPTTTEEVNVPAKCEYEPFWFTNGLTEQAPWFQSILSPKDMAYVIVKKHEYKTGLDDDLIDYNGLNKKNIKCSNSKDNKSGYCRMLLSCDVMINHIKSKEEYEKHFCLIDGFAGVCCPRLRT